MEKRGNEVVLQSSVSSKSICLNAVEEVFSTEDIKDVMCIKSLSKIRDKNVYACVTHIKDENKQTAIKNFSVEEKRVSATLILPYQDMNDVPKSVKIPFEFLRQTPHLNGDENYSDICFEVLSNLKEVSEDSIEYEFEVTLKEESERIGGFLIRKTIALKTRNIDFDAFVGEFN